MAEIKSRQHPRIREARTFRDPSVRRKEGRFLAEGIRLLEEAFESGLFCEGFFYTRKLTDRRRGKDLLERARRSGTPVYEVAESVLDVLKETKTVQGAVALFRLPAPAPPENISFSVMACEIRDPGNLGTMARMCEAGGADEILLTPETVEPFNPKSLRAGMGSLFRLPVLAIENPVKLLRERRNQGFQIAATVPRGGSAPADIPLNLPTVLLIGGEAGGLSDAFLAEATLRITIPMFREVESLNAALATAILLYERMRQKKTGFRAGG